MKITGFIALDEEGSALLADAHGNNVAFNCLSCGHPILAIARDHQRGFSEASPADCKGCQQKHFLDVRPEMEKFYVIKY
ncbi:hypothetical protein A9Q99_21085 [Gammaproteobacteria bacterium 45_16_T64]|nr:hypothetical protein A9Q99_21085 [Gammaproteobacteria bacterium 45_16_T64]